MHSVLSKIKNFLSRHPQKILWSAILIYILIFSLISLWKYQNYSYNGLDLAIFNQVFYNTSRGWLFDLTIHPHSYLGDHLAFTLLLLVPFYAILKSPLSPLFLQTIILGLLAWPVFLIGQKIFKVEKQNLAPEARKTRISLALLLALAILLNPIIQNINLFEFHILPLAVFFLLFAFYFYLRKNLPVFLAFLILALLTREDVFLVVFTFGILAFVDNFSKIKKGLPFTPYTLQSLSWILVPIILSLVWFFLSLKITAYFSPQGSYKFLSYYSWLGSSIPEIIKNIFLHPWMVFKHFLTLYNLEMILGFLLAFGWFPLFRPKYLILAAGVFLQILIGAPGGSSFILETHYASLFLPALIVATLSGADRVLQIKPTPLGSKFLFRLWRDKTFLFLVFFLAIIYASLTLGPLLPVVAKMVKRNTVQTEVNQLKNHFLAQVPEEASLATTYEFLTKLSSRPKIYALNYAFIGRRQFSAGDYVLPEDTEYLLIDFNDFITYQLQFPRSSYLKDYYSKGDDNIRRIIRERNFGLVEIADDIALFKKDYPDKIELYKLYSQAPEINYQQEIILDSKIKFLGWGEIDYRLPKTNFQFYWQALKPLQENYQLNVEILDQNNKVVWQKLYPLAYGIYPASQWRPEEIVQTNYYFFLPPEILKKKDHRLALSLVKIKGAIELDGMRSVVQIFDLFEPLGEKIFLK